MARLSFFGPAFIRISFAVLVALVDSARVQVRSEDLAAAGSQLESDLDVGLPPQAVIGAHALGTLRARLPAAGGSATRGLFAQLHYPADADAPLLGLEPFPYFRSEVIEALATSQGLPQWLMRFAIGARAEQLDPARAPAHAPRGWPVIIFSHGLFGTAEFYTQLCRELASMGFIVIAVEHEDGSALYAVDAVTGETIPYTQDPRDFDSMTKGEHMTFRQPFLEKRHAELSHTAALVAEAARASLAEDISGSLEDVALSRVLRRADAGRLLLAGHSFGATGVVHHLHRLAESTAPLPYHGVLLADVWTEPLPTSVLASGLQLPFNFLLSDEFAHKENMVPEYLQLISASGDQCLSAVHISESNHQWISDTHFWFPSWLNEPLGVAATSDHDRVHRATMRALWLGLRALLQGDPVANSAELRRQLTNVDRDILGLWPTQ